MTVLVTGAGGFIGSRLVELLLATGHRVRALASFFLSILRIHRS
jgi:nucleoside-diphosphate-sugar epimerase